VIGFKSFQLIMHISNDALVLELLLVFAALLWFYGSPPPVPLSNDQVVVALERIRLRRHWLLRGWDWIVATLLRPFRGHPGVASGRGVVVVGSGPPSTLPFQRMRLSPSPSCINIPAPGPSGALLAGSSGNDTGGRKHHHHYHHHRLQNAAYWFTELSLLVNIASLTGTCISASLRPSQALFSVLLCAHDVSPHFRNVTPLGRSRMLLACFSYVLCVYLAGFVPWLHFLGNACALAAALGSSSHCGLVLLGGGAAVGVDCEWTEDDDALQQHPQQQAQTAAPSVAAERVTLFSTRNRSALPDLNHTDTGAAVNPGDARYYWHNNTDDETGASHHYGGNTATQASPSPSSIIIGMGNAAWIEHALIVLPYAAYGGMLLFERAALGNPMFITWSIYAVACMTTGTALAVECHMAQSSKRRGGGTAMAASAPDVGGVGVVGPPAIGAGGHEEMTALDVSGLATVQ
jgi:hypothetical protein